MQKLHTTLFIMSLIIIQHQSIFTINWKAPFIATLLASKVTSECAIYNTAKQPVIIQDSNDNLWSKKKISTVQIPGQSKAFIHPCIHLNIIPDNKNTQIQELNYNDQPHGWSLAYTITEKPCENNCTQITQTIKIEPGVPGEFTSSLKKLSAQEIGYVAQQLRRHPETVIQEATVCKNSQLRKNKY
ncbi:MAG: hypothetical protein ACXWL2_03095 [Candidatus Chromulinivorax sp.]